MKIRQEQENDFNEIYELVEKAFKTAQVSDGDEQDLVNKLRSSEDYIPELSLVAEEDGKLIGHIMLTKVNIANSDNKFASLIIAPVSVALQHRNKGVGSALISNSFELAKKLGFTSVVLIGNPDYYHRFGFRKSSEFNIKYKFEIPEKYVMAKELVANALQGISGIIDFKY